MRYVGEQMGPDGNEFLLSRALADAIGALGPAFRNHPIQGAVADICGRAFAELLSLRDEFPDLVWVQSVHDSIIGECDEANAVAVAVRMTVAMEQAMESFFPTVPSKVDAEVCVNLDESGIEVEIDRDMVNHIMGVTA